MKCVTCYAPNTQIDIQEKIVLDSYALILNKAYDTPRDSFEKLKCRVNYYRRKMMHTGEHNWRTKRQET